MLALSFNYNFSHNTGEGGDGKTRGSGRTRRGAVELRVPRLTACGGTDGSHFFTISIESAANFAVFLLRDMKSFACKEKQN